ncbi:hypothetical protein [Coleofasciculus sp. FACHB-SPT9]|uniref:hypothetical protein n=1 Tax=Cyanophyceae TaxID=3028117 RepID=UPI0016880281|nr:hypothetical protein [Coleofasciculus sp. FACHB-SPT9]MBD1889356.1 hypothetical protein [Coleofasciculus sp. FACHB-SPT9]
MSSDRLRQVEENLQLLREQQGSVERESLLTTGIHKIQAEQRLRLDIKPKLIQFETEYWQILANESETIAIAEPAPEVVVAEIIERAGQLQTSQQYPDEVLEWLQKIYAEVSKPGTTAAAKLKGALSLLPPFVSLSYEYEKELDADFLQKHFPTFTKWSKALVKKS